MFRAVLSQRINRINLLDKKMNKSTNDKYLLQSPWFIFVSINALFMGYIGYRLYHCDRFNLLINFKTQIFTLFLILIKLILFIKFQVFNIYYFDRLYRKSITNLVVIHIRDKIIPRRKKNIKYGMSYSINLRCAIIVITAVQKL